LKLNHLSVKILSKIISSNEWVIVENGFQHKNIIPGF
jgi:hypothetical protein